MHQPILVAPCVHQLLASLTRRSAAQAWQRRLPWPLMHGPARLPLQAGRRAWPRRARPARLPSVLCPSAVKLGSRSCPLGSPRQWPPLYRCASNNFFDTSRAASPPLPPPLVYLPSLLWVAPPCLGPPATSASLVPMHTHHTVRRTPPHTKTNVLAPACPPPPLHACPGPRTASLLLAALSHVTRPHCCTALLCLPHSLP